VAAVCFRKSRRDDEGMLRSLLRSIPPLTSNLTELENRYLTLQ